jgi:NAD(P)H-dependent FMN reductase
MGLAFTTVSAAILEAASPGQEGVVSAAMQLAQVLGAAVATGLGGAIVAAPFAGDPPARGIAVTDAVMLATIAVALATTRGVPDRHDVPAGESAAAAERPPASAVAP